MNYIDQIEAAIQAHAIGTPFEAALTGGLFNGVVPECAQGPYGELSWIGIKDESTFSEEINKGKIQFQFWGGVKTDVNEILCLCEQAYNDSMLNSNEIDAAPDGNFTLHKENIFPAERDTRKRQFQWTGVIDFRIMFQTKII